MHKYTIVVPQLHLVSTCFLSDRFVDPILYTSMHSVERAFPSTDSDVLATCLSTFPIFNNSPVSLSPLYMYVLYLFLVRLANNTTTGVSQHF